MYPASGEKGQICLEAGKFRIGMMEQGRVELA
jgi:hypothetical protein